MMNKEGKKKPQKKITIDVPRDLYREVHVVILGKYDSTYGHLREALIEGLKMWLKKQKKLAKKEEKKNVE